MAQNKRTERQRAIDLDFVEDLYVRCVPINKILQELNDSRPYSLTQQMLSYDLAAIRERWKKRSESSIMEQISKELASLDKIESEAWEAWKRSQGKAETLTRKGKKAAGSSAGADGKGESGETIEVTKREEDQIGDPRFLAEARACVVERRKMMGLDKPSRIKVSTAPDPEDVIAAMEARLAAGTD